MSPMRRYQIFQKLLFKPPVRIENATSLEDAKNRWNELTLMFPGEYFILDSESSVFIVPSDTERTREPKQLQRGTDSSAF